MDEKYIAIKILSDTCGKVLSYPQLYPESIIKAAYNYLFNGCNNRGEYVLLVATIVKDYYTRNILLKM